MSWSFLAQERRARAGRRPVGRPHARRRGGAGHLGHGRRAWCSSSSVVGLLLWRGGRARRWGLAVLVGYVAADLALLLAGRAGFGQVIGLDPRYSSDTLHAAVLCVALCLRGASWPAPDRKRVRVLVVGRPASASRTASPRRSVRRCSCRTSRTPTTATSSTNLRDDLAADPTQVIVDDLAPEELLLPLVGDDSRYSASSGRCPSCPPSTSRRRASGWWVRTGGSIRSSWRARCRASPVRTTTAATPCRRRPRTWGSRSPVDGRLLLRVRYFTGAEATVRVRVEDWTDDFLARRGPNEVWLVLPDLPVRS